MINVDRGFVMRCMKMRSSIKGHNFIETFEASITEGPHFKLAINTGTYSVMTTEDVAN